MANVNLFSGGSILNNLLPKIKIRYPQNYVEISSAGHVLERNNTKEGERFRLIHALGNTIDMDEKRNTNTNMVIQFRKRNTRIQSKFGKWNIERRQNIKAVEQENEERTGTVKTTITKMASTHRKTPGCKF